MITAHAAKKKTDTLRDTTVSKVKAVMRLIEAAIKEGEYFVNIYRGTTVGDYLNDESVKVMLTGPHYKLSTSSYGHGVSWVSPV